MLRQNSPTGHSPLVQMIEANAFEWLSNRSDRDASSHVKKCGVELATSKGGYRESNQDLSAFFYVSDQTYAHAPLAAAVVADGMGGMEDGGIASARAISAFIAFLSAGKAPVGLKSLLLAATLYANQRVHEELRGNGGTTLSAVLYGKQGVIGLNVGDSRIYAIGQHSVRRLTVDDTLGEQFRHFSGGAIEGELSQDNRLVQFVGIGPILEPHIIDLGVVSENTQYTHFLLSTDGAHCIGDETIASLLKAGIPITELASNLVDISRRCGSTDNSSAILAPARVGFSTLLRPVQELALDVPTSSFQILLLKGRDGDADKQDEREESPARMKDDTATNVGQAVVQENSAENLPNELLSSKIAKKSRKKTKRGGAQQGQPVLEFIEPMPENSDDKPGDSN